MSTERYTELATEFLNRFTANDLTGALDLLSDDATWWIAGKPELLPAAGLHTKEQIAGLLKTMTRQLTTGLNMTVKGLLAEGDKVAIEVESYGELRNGRIYNQHYHMLMTIRDGKISSVREYLDTQHVFATWFQL